MNAWRWVRAVLGVVVVAILFAVVLNWWGDYQDARGKSTTEQAETTATVEPTPTAQPPAPEEAASEEEPAENAAILIVQVQGLNFRRGPSGAAKAYRGLAKGEEIVLLGQEGDWFKVRDSEGNVGYVTANPAYTKRASE